MMVIAHITHTHTRMYIPTYKQKDDDLHTYTPTHTHPYTHRSPTSKNIKTDQTDRMYVSDAVEVEVSSAEDAIGIFKKGLCVLLTMIYYYFFFLLFYLLLQLFLLIIFFTLHITHKITLNSLFPWSKPPQTHPYKHTTPPPKIRSEAQKSCSHSIEFRVKSQSLGLHHQAGAGAFRCPGGACSHGWWEFGYWYMFVCVGGVLLFRMMLQLYYLYVLDFNVQIATPESAQLVYLKFKLCSLNIFFIHL